MFSRTFYASLPSEASDRILAGPSRTFYDIMYDIMYRHITPFLHDMTHCLYCYTDQTWSVRWHSMVCAQGATSI